jgi:Putative mono-oxygenase ydhR
LRTSDNPLYREAAVDAIVITFDLVDMTPEQYAQLAAELAPSFAALPGLLTKIWLTDTDHGQRGGFYLFDDAAAAEGFLKSALALGVAQNPHFAHFTAQRFTVDQATTAMTQSKIKVVPDVDPGWSQEGW